MSQLPTIIEKLVSDKFRQASCWSEPKSKRRLRAINQFVVFFSWWEYAKTTSCFQKKFTSRYWQLTYIHRTFLLATCALLLSTCKSVVSVSSWCLGIEIDCHSTWLSVCYSFVFCHRNFVVKLYACGGQPWRIF
jgi:hypothetical protein